MAGRRADQAAGGRCDGQLSDRVLGLIGPIFLLAFLGFGALMSRRTHGALLLVLAAGLARISHTSRPSRTGGRWLARVALPARRHPVRGRGARGGLEALERGRAELRIGTVAVLAWASGFVTFVYVSAGT